MRQGHAEKTVFNPKTDVKARGVTPGAASQIGEVVGQNPDGAKAPTPHNVRTTACEEGPGGGRTIHECGSQGKHE